MKVATAIKYLQELDPEAHIYAQWYDQSDMSKMGVNGEETVPNDVWELAIAIADKWETPDMHDSIHEAIYIAKQRLANEEE